MVGVEAQLATEELGDRKEIDLEGGDDAEVGARAPHRPEQLAVFAGGGTSEVADAVPVPGVHDRNWASGTRRHAHGAYDGGLVRSLDDQVGPVVNCDVEPAP